MSVLVFDKDDTLFEYYVGSAQVDEELPVDPNTSFYIASSTKSLIATIVLKLVEDGILDLDVPISEYLPDLHFDSWFISENRITLRRLLTHDTGISSKPLEIRTSITGEWDRSSLMTLFGKAGYSWSKPQYSNLNFILIGLLLEAVTGKPWQDLLQERLFVPLNMNRSFATWESSAGNVAYPHSLRPDGTLYVVPGDHSTLKNNTLFPSGGVIASARDLAKYVQLFLNCGKTGESRYLDSATISSAISAHAMNEGGGEHEYVGFGFGWEIALHGDLMLVLHGGSNRVGARSYMGFSPDLGIGLVILSNENIVPPYVQAAIARFVWDWLADSETATLELDRNLARWKDNIARRFEGRMEEQDSPVFDYPDVPLHEFPLSKYAGLYEDSEYGTVVVSVKAGQLQIRYGNYVSARVKRLTDHQFVGDFVVGLEQIKFSSSGQHIIGIEFQDMGFFLPKVE